jgi:hypothetical protein
MSIARLVRSLENVMEGVFEVSFGSTFTALQRYRFRAYRRLSKPIGLRLEEWETNRLYRR